MKNEISVKSFGVMSRQQFWKVIGLTLLVCGSLHGQQIIQFDVPPTPMNGIPGGPAALEKVCSSLQIFS
jgi:hypothetical protein